MVCRTVISGEVRDTAQLNSIESLLLDRVLDLKKRIVYVCSLAKLVICVGAACGGVG